jgi:hypothetical protein
MPFTFDHHSRWAAILPACLCLAPAAAVAQILDRIEISRINGKAEIRIDFGVQVQYLNHTPPGKGKELNIFIKPIAAAPPGSEAIEETLTAPQTDIVSPFTVLYPHLGNAVSIRFASETAWEVRPMPDGRSIVIVVPALKGARDLVTEVRALPAPPKPKVVPAPVPAPVAAAPAAAAVVPAPSAPPAPPAPPTAPAPSAPSVPPAATPPTQAPAPAAEDAGPTAPALTNEQIESMAKGFMVDASKAIEDKDLARAINRLNRTLGLPNNAQTESAQAMIGEVREMNGEIAKARAEYELYLKLYPKGADAKRIQERLAALPKVESRAQSRNRPLQRGPAEWMYYGSLAQYYYTGKSHIEITTPPPPGLLDFTTDKLSQTDQNALITTLDLNARRRDGITDTRIVVRDTDLRNFLDSSRNYNRLYAAYAEQSDRQLGYFVRVGRQTPTGGGVLERFDGLNAGYTFADHWRINGVGGEAVDFYSSYKRIFYGASLEMLPQPESIGLTAYAIRQDLDGALNRQAVGLESRYFDTHASVFGMLDYDTLYKGVNIAMLQGNYRSDDGINYYTYIDHRKAPPYSLTNAYAVLQNGMTLKEAIKTVGLEQVRTDARLLTATSNMLSVGVSVPVSPSWQIGTDYRAASYSGTKETWTYPTVDNPIPVLIPATKGTGTNHVLGLQAIGTNLWGVNDVAVINANYIKGQSYIGVVDEVTGSIVPNVFKEVPYNGQALGGNYVYMLGDSWRFDINLRYYQQKDDLNEKQRRTSPSLKIGYRWDPVTLEAEAGQEYVKIDGPERKERSDRTYIFLGYRLDLR